MKDSCLLQSITALAALAGLAITSARSTDIAAEVVIVSVVLLISDPPYSTYD